MRARLLLGLALGLAALVLAGDRLLGPKAAEKGTGRPNVVLVSIDTLRLDHVSAFGYGRPTTPALEALARDGFRFERAYSPMPITGPAHTSLMTGLTPRGHGVRNNGAVLAASAVTLAERLREAGYRTGAIVSGYPLAQRFGLAQGFDSYDDQFEAASASIPAGNWEGEPLKAPYDRRADATVERALRWLERQGPSAQPFFLFLHLFDPHSPYDPPEPHASAFATAAGSVADRYDGEIAFADAQLGRFFEALRRQGLRERTLIVVASDHGEGLGDHGQAEHGWVVYEEAVRVPLLFSWPGGLRPGSSSALVSLADVAPTLLELVGAAPLPRVADSGGRSLAAILLDRSHPWSRHVTLEADHSHRWPQRAATDGRLKLVESGSRRLPQRELFDLLLDPHELHDILPANPLMAEAMAKHLPGRAPGGLRTPGLDAEGREALRALGYVE